ncbi:FecR family protein [Gracilinema caldarium]|uniref:FecR family protein n=1 Tax=Gracilinema caldarium TaxID=215591 RepID=UPI0016983796|nr:FecR family protein [Gracilinema caldarium]NLJ08915.1 FecR domain-containing protein [Treponema sp.]
MKRQTYLFSFLLMIFSGSLLFSGPVREKDSDSHATSTNQIVKIKLSYVDGEVSIDGKPAEVGQLLPLKCSIKTGRESSCEIIFSDKNIIQIRQNTQTTLDFTAPSIQIELKTGGVAAVLKKLTKVINNDDSFIINSPAASAGVRGTSLCVWSDGTNSYVCTCNGTVRTLDPKGSNEIVTTAAHHTAHLYVPKESEYTVMPAGLEHHTDEDIEKLAEKIGVTIDWTRAD